MKRRSRALATAGQVGSPWSRSRRSGVPETHVPAAPPVSGPHPGVNGSGRRAQSSRAWLRGRQLVACLATGGISLLLLAMLQGVFAEYRWLQGKVDARSRQLHALRAQYHIGKARLASLQSRKGREEVLLEHGYIRPGDRILLFPDAPGERRLVSLPTNDLTVAAPPTDTAPPTATAGWGRATSTVRGWWNSILVRSPQPPPGASARGVASSQSEVGSPSG